MVAILLRSWVLMTVFWIALCFFKMRGQHVLGERFTPDEFIAAAAIVPVGVLVIGAAVVGVLRFLFERMRPSRSQWS
jgi:uncharacterized membrane protein